MLVLLRAHTCSAWLWITITMSENELLATAGMDALVRPAEHGGVCGVLGEQWGLVSWTSLIPPFSASCGTVKQCVYGPP